MLEAGALGRRSRSSRAASRDALEAFAENTLRHLRDEAGAARGRDRAAAARRRASATGTRSSSRAAPATSPTCGWCGPYVRDFRPVLVAVDGGADALREVGLQADVIVGDFDSVSDAALLAGRRAASSTPTRTGARRAPSGCARPRAARSTSVAAPGISEDLALQLAHEQRRGADRRRRHALQPRRVPRARPRGHGLHVRHAAQGGRIARGREGRLAARQPAASASGRSRSSRATGIAAIVVAVLASPGAAQRARVDHARDRQRARALTPCRAATARTGPRLSACSTSATTSPRSRPSSSRSCSGIFVGVGLSGSRFRQRRRAGEPPVADRGAAAQSATTRSLAPRRPVSRGVGARRLRAYLVSATSSAPGSTGARSESSSSAPSTRGSPRRVRRAVDDAGGRIGSLRALRVPLDDEAVDAALARRPGDARPRRGGQSRAARTRARSRARHGGARPGARPRSRRSSSRSSRAGDAARSTPSSSRGPRDRSGGETQTFLAGLYGGLAAAPASRSRRRPGRRRGDRRARLSPQRPRDGRRGRRRRPARSRSSTCSPARGSGSYGVGKTAVDGVLPAPARRPQPPVGE